MLQILSAETILNKLVSEEFNGKQSFIIYKTLKAVNKEIEDFNEARQKLIYKYAKKDENGELIVVDDSVSFNGEEAKIFQEEIQDLLTAEVEIICNKIPVDWLEKIQLTPQEIFSIEAFIE